MAQVGVGGGAASVVLPMEAGQGRVVGQARVVAVAVAVAVAAVQVPATAATQLLVATPWAQATATTAAWHHGPTAGSGTRCGKG